MQNPAGQLDYQVNRRGFSESIPSPYEVGQEIRQRNIEAKMFRECSAGRPELCTQTAGFSLHES
jgi:hypothetical protein